jgi:hypothetical protein
MKYYIKEHALCVLYLYTTNHVCRHFPFYYKNHVFMYMAGCYTTQKDKRMCVLYSYITMHVYFTLTSQSMWFAAFSLLLQKPRVCVYVLYLYANKLKIVVKLISKLSCTVHVFYIDIFVMQKI